MLKRDELSDPNSAWNKIPDDEPVFILRAQDLTASNTVRQWANNLIWNRLAPDKVDEALALADKMDKWPTRKMPD